MALRPWLQLIRVQNLPTALADVWAGFAIGRMIQTEQSLLLWPVDWRLPYDTLMSKGDWILVVLASLASLGFYSAGMVLNDYADRDRDRRLHPERPIPSGAVSSGQAVRLGVLLLVLGVVAAFRICVPAEVESPEACLPVLVPALLVAMILAYNFRLKSNPLLGSASLGLARGLNWLLGASAGFPDLVASALRALTELYRYAFGFQLVGYHFFERGMWGVIPPAMMASYAAAVTLSSTAEESPARGRPRIGVGTAIMLLAILVSCFWGTACRPGAIFLADASMLEAQRAYEFAMERDIIGAWLLATILGLLILVRGTQAMIGNSVDRVRKLVLVGVRGYVVLDAVVVLAWGSPQAAGAILGLLAISMLLGMVFRGS